MWGSGVLSLGLERPCVWALYVGVPAPTPWGCRGVGDRFVPGWGGWGGTGHVYLEENVHVNHKLHEKIQGS